MASFNRVIMMGNLTRDPEQRTLPSGQMVCRFGLACNRSFKNRQTGSVTQEVCFIDVDVWGPQAETCQQYLSKGRSVLVEGRLKLDSWEQEGQKRSKHSIVAERVTFLGNGGDDASAQDSSSAQDDFTAAAATPSFQGRATGEVNLKSQPKPFDDDLPF